MVSTCEYASVYDARISSVVPASITGEEKIHDLKYIDLAMKLHYIRGVYFFNKDAAQGLQIEDLKRPMFDLLQLYYPVAGRIRKTDHELDARGRPFIKCNDSGVRIVEAKCSKTLHEWLAAASGDSSGSFEQLVHGHVLGPDLGFAPLVFLQFTWFKCGGISVGLSWSHILGDVFSASDFINRWGQILADDQLPTEHLVMPKPSTKNDKTFPSFGKVPYSIKMVDPVGDHWQTINNSKMQVYSFHLTAKQLNLLTSEAFERSRDLSAKVKPFEVISAIMWKSLAKIRGESEPKIVTICRRNDFASARLDLSLSNSQVISTVEIANSKVAEADLVDLANVIARKQEDERSLIEQVMESEKGKYDYIIYGANLTFIDLEEAKIYDLGLNGHKPSFANYSVNGVGDEGAILVLPGPAKEGGRIVNLILPENQVANLKNELRKEWSIF